MSLITRCPSCETLFKVVPDQLRISDGWVRCGQCDDIFDASLHLLPVQPAEKIPIARTESGRRAENTESITSTTVTEALPEPDDVKPEPVCEIPPDESLPEQESVEPEPEPESAEAEAEAEADVTQDSPELIQVQLSPVEKEIFLPEELTEPQAQAEADDDEFVDKLDPSDVSFLHGKQNNVFWRKPIKRTPLLILSLALLIGLVGQIVVYERDRIVALEPNLKPWLQAICLPLNCILSPLRQIESIVIDSSSFTKIRGDSYRLNLTLKNTAAIALAVPSIELTLTDALDLPVARRVFLASEIGAKSDTLKMGAEWPASIVMLIKSSGTSERVAGYRVIAFYP